MKQIGKNPRDVYILPQALGFSIRLGRLFSSYPRIAFYKLCDDTDADVLQRARICAQALASAYGSCVYEAPNLEKHIKKIKGIGQYEEGKASEETTTRFADNSEIP